MVMKNKINQISTVSFTFDLLMPILWIIQAIQQDKYYNINIFFAFFSASLIFEAVTGYRFGKPINKSGAFHKYPHWFYVNLGIIMFIVSIGKLVLG
jgi:hypothetical protein